MIKVTLNLYSVILIEACVGVLIDGAMCSRDQGVFHINHSVVIALRLYKVSYHSKSLVSTGLGYPKKSLNPKRINSGWKVDLVILEN